jgi:hypothetical protein
VDQHVVDARLADAWYVDPQLRVDRGTHGHSPLGDALDVLAPDGEADARGLHDGEDVADTDGDVEGDLAHALDLDDLVGERHERRRPLEGDLADALVLPARDRLDGPRLGVDEDPCLGPLAAHHPGLDRHRRRADGALAAGDVVAARVDEEQAELRPRRDRLGEHGDQQAAVSARLQAQARPDVVEILLEPTALVCDGRARHAAETAREQPHPDAGGVEVDGRQHTIGAHETSRVEAMKLRCGNQVKRLTLDTSAFDA